MRSSQHIFEQTGGLHAAALFDADGRLLESREDVGRHNAVDKFIGNALLVAKMPFRDRLLLVSGRVSFEIVQKAAAAGIPITCAVSAPSSLAVQAGERLGMTVVGFLRGTSSTSTAAGTESTSGPDARHRTRSSDALASGRGRLCKQISGGDHERVEAATVDVVEKLAPHGRRPEHEDVIGYLRRGLRLGMVAEVSGDLVCHAQQVGANHSSAAQRRAARSGATRSDGTAVDTGPLFTLKRARTSTAVTLYSGQLVAQSECSVVTTLAPVTGWWNVV